MKTEMEPHTLAEVFPQIDGEESDKLAISPVQRLTKYEAMLAAISECHRADEAKAIRDKARALEVLARQARNTEAEWQVAEIRLRAERRCGQLLGEMKDAGERHAGHQDQKSESARMTPILTLEDLGISKQQSSDWQRLAEIDEQRFDAFFSQTQESMRWGGPPATTAALLRYGREVQALTEFPECDENIPTEFCCPRCNYSWSGSPKGGRRPDLLIASES